MAFDRRDFLKGAVAGAALLLTADKLIAAEEASTDTPVPGPPVKIGVIGLGLWGKEILTNLSKLPSAQIVAICDGYEPYIKRVSSLAPNAAVYTDYKKLLESPDVEAVIIATPTHQHKDIALAAIQAGKHVYCEAPLAANMEDAKTIALSGKGSSNVFQVGLQGRSNKLYTHVAQFVKAGVLGNSVGSYAQWHKRQSWRRPAPTKERENEINWRLDKDISIGLIGEEGIHHLDLAGWYYNSVPKSVMGFGAITSWNDGRGIPDTVQYIVEYPNGVRSMINMTLASSFSGSYSVFQGSQATLALRESEGWMVKEADSPLLGWEVYARKEPCFGETGICMVADATKILAQGKEPGKDSTGAPAKSSLYSALEDFTRSIREKSAPMCGAEDGYKATVTAIKANEAVVNSTKIDYRAEWFDLG